MLIVSVIREEEASVKIKQLRSSDDKTKTLSSVVDRCNRRMKCEDDGEERRDFDEETMGRSDEKSGAEITKFSFLPMKAVKAREELLNIVSRRLK